MYIVRRFWPAPLAKGILPMEKVTFKIVSAEQDYSALMKYNMFQKKKALPLTENTSSGKKCVNTVFL